MNHNDNGNGKLEFLAGRWAELERGYLGAGMPLRDLELHRATFYTGNLAVLVILRQAADEGMSEDEVARLLDTLWAESLAFHDAQVRRLED